jgi:acyl-homoserine lactone acylase PvdQ
VPLEFKLTAYHPDEWTPADCLTMVTAAGDAGLAQTQGDMEKFILHQWHGQLENRRG